MTYNVTCPLCGKHVQCNARGIIAGRACSNTKPTPQGPRHTTRGPAPR